jgi:hypothetical protein
LAVLDADEETRLELADRGFHALMMMVLKHNFIHADLHPGNILVQGPAPVRKTESAALAAEAEAAAAAAEEKAGLKYAAAAAAAAVAAAVEYPLLPEEGSRLAECVVGQNYRTDDEGGVVAWGGGE